MKRYKLMDYEEVMKNRNRVASIIGRSRKEGWNWTEKVTEREITRLLISSKHYDKIKGTDFGSTILKMLRLWRKDH